VRPETLCGPRRSPSFRTQRVSVPPLSKLRNGLVRRAARDETLSDIVKRKHIRSKGWIFRRLRGAARRARKQLRKIRLIRASQSWAPLDRRAPGCV
jgi:hypothetical protein